LQATYNTIITACVGSELQDDNGDPSPRTLEIAFQPESLIFSSMHVAYAPARLGGYRPASSARADWVDAAESPGSWPMNGGTTSPRH
jgi:hypothetical protein